MSLTTQLRDFLIQKKVKKLFENYMLENHPCLANSEGRFDWTGNKYERYIMNTLRSLKRKMQPEHMLGMEIGYKTFSWAITNEGNEFWWHLCSEFGQLVRNKQE